MPCAAVMRFFLKVKRLIYKVGNEHTDHEVTEQEFIKECDRVSQRPESRLNSLSTEQNFPASSAAH